MGSATLIHRHEQLHCCAPSASRRGSARLSGDHSSSRCAHIPVLIDELNADLSHLEQRLDAALASAEPLGWGEVMDPLHRLGERLRWSWGVVSHLNGVCNSPELREAHQSQQAAVVDFGNRAGQSHAIYRALERLQEQHRAGHLPSIPPSSASSPPSCWTCSCAVWGWRASDQAAFNAASEELAELATRFGNHVLDATNGWTLALNTPEEVDGLPASLRQLLAQAAREAGLSGADGRRPAPKRVPGCWGSTSPAPCPF